MEIAANKIKNFFNQKKVAKSFKKAGPGRKLNDDPSSSSAHSKSGKKPSDIYVPIKRDDLTDEAKKARDAAIERLKLKQSGPLNFSLKSIKEQARRELEQQNSKQELEASVSNLNIAQENSACENYSVDGVFFRCPLVSDEILPKKEWKGKIKSFLYEQMSSDPGLTACLIIKNCNIYDNASDCVETLKKYLTNIISNPTETKYQRIRKSNRIFCEKVSNVEGAMEFMKAAGFKEVIVDSEEFLVWSSEYPLELLIQLCEALDLCEVIQLEIDRNVKVLLPSQANSVSLPPDFFRLSKEEILNEQKTK
jgi:UBX domain-containing protein 6